MRLSWSNPSGIAAALLLACPEEDRLALDHARLTELVLALPGFDGSTAAPSAQTLDHIRWTWMRLADEGFHAA